MATLTELREELAQLVENLSGFPAFAYLLERPTPPVSMVSPGNPYVVGDEDGTAFNEWRVNYRVDVVAPNATNGMKTEKIDETIGDLLAGLDSSGYLVGNVSAPYGLELNGATYLAVTLDISIYNRF